MHYANDSANILSKNYKKNKLIMITSFSINVMLLYIVEKYHKKG